MEPTDEMVEAALREQTEFLNNVDGVDAGMVWPDSWDEAGQAIKRGAMRAALAVMPGQYRAGWIAGRDAAASVADNWTWAENAARHIRALEPPS